ncbi:MAG: hypothetical protein HPY53_10095 [Brevinematales bacterium]|nr:hypothetical protein [Brevinematales bacterium]
MNTLILNPGKNSLKFSLSDKNAVVIYNGRIENYRGIREGDNIIRQVMESAGYENERIGTVAIRVINGGGIFDNPCVYNKEVREKLETLIPMSPINIPVVMQLAGSCANVFPDTPVIIFFETAFFTVLPER